MDELVLDVRLGEADSLIGVGDFAAAKALLTDTTTMYPNSARAWKELGVAEDKLENNDVAERYLLRSLDLDASDGDAWSVLGGLYFYDLGRDDDASRCFRRSLAVDPSNTYALTNYLTITAATDAVDSSPSEFGPAMKQGKQRCAVQIEQGLNIPWSYYDLGQILFFQGRSDECRAAVREGIVHSSAWQVGSARLPYEKLARTVRFAADARVVLGEFPHAKPAD